MYICVCVCIEKMAKFAIFSKVLIILFLMKSFTKIFNPCACDFTFNGSRLMNLEGKVALIINTNFGDQITQVQAPGQGSN